MVTLFLLPHLEHKFGKPDLSPQKPLEYSRGVKRINCIVDVPISYAKGIPTCKKKLEVLANAGIRTIEDLFHATEKTFSVLERESFYSNIITVWENIQRHTFIYKKSMVVPKHLYLRRKYKTKEEHLIVCGMAIFDPIFKSKKVARNALIERLPPSKVNHVEKKKQSGIIRNLQQKKQKYAVKTA